MALIPIQTGGTDHRGHVVIWDQGYQYGGPHYGTYEKDCQRWAILDPETQETWNYYLQLPAGNTIQNSSELTDLHGDLFCSGMSWSEDGHLVVAGGTVYMSGQDHPELGDLYAGGKNVFVWRPEDWGNIATQYGWVLQVNPLEQERYYPSVTLMADGKMLISGGFDFGYKYSNSLGTTYPNATQVPSTYEVFTENTAAPTQ